MNSKEITVGLLWHSITSDNLGVGALTIGQMALITEASRRLGFTCQFIVIGTTGGTAYNIKDFSIRETAEFTLTKFKSGNFKAITLMRRCDIVFDIGEGDSFADIYGLKRLFMQVLSKVLCVASGTTLVLSPQTIGPFKSRSGRLLGKLGLAVAKRVFVRDQLSLDYVRSLGYGHKASEVIDVAFALPYQTPQVPDSPRRFGINVSGLMMHTAGNFGFTLDYKALIGRVCELLLAQPDAEVYLVPHVICDAAEVEDDLRASQQLVRQYPGLKLAPRFTSPSEAKSFISGLDFLTGARMHACIAAISSGVPVVPMAYSRKFNGLFSSLNYPHVLDCLKQSTDEGVEMIAAAVANLSQLKNDVDRGRQLAAPKIQSYVDQIEGLLKS